MRFRLQHLLIAVTLFGILLGRVSYLKQWGDYHGREAARLTAVLEQRYQWSHEELNALLLTRPPNQKCDLWELLNHRQLEAEYRAAMFRPWTTVKERKYPE
jgi:hypothetical protein